MYVACDMLHIVNTRFRTCLVGGAVGFLVDSSFDQEVTVKCLI